MLNACQEKNHRPAYFKKSVGSCHEVCALSVFPEFRCAGLEKLTFDGRITMQFLH